MTALVKTLASISAGDFRVEFGTAYWDGSTWFAEVAGQLLNARWLDPIQPQQGGPIAVALITDGRGQSSALVLGGYTDQPRPSTGSITTVIPAGVSTQIVFEGEDGREYTTDRFVGSYSPGDPVYLTWDAAQPTILGAISAVVEPPPAAPPVGPPAIMPGSTTLIATASDTWGVGGWGRWAGSTNGREKVYSGSYSGYTLAGAWFYGAPRPELAGKTINRIRFYLPPRLGNIGSSGTVTVHIYGHTSGARPGGDVNRTTPPTDVAIPGGFNGVFVDLDPGTYGPILTAGGGISIAGDPYVGFLGRLDYPESGKVLIDWSA